MGTIRRRPVLMEMAMAAPTSFRINARSSVTLNRETTMMNVAMKRRFSAHSLVILDYRGRQNWFNF